jgi:hypothetical protein
MCKSKEQLIETSKEKPVLALLFFQIYSDLETIENS